MKRIVMVFIALCLCVCAYAQTFNGVELTDSSREFRANYLKVRQSASVVYSDATDCTINDKYLSYPATISIQPHDNKWRLFFEIRLPDNSNWDALISRYNEVLLHFTALYGKPTPYHTFAYPFNNNMHIGKEIVALKTGKCQYTDLFYCGKWKISLALEYAEDFENPGHYFCVSALFLPR